MDETNPTNPDLTVFTAALRLPAADRPAYLEQACGSDPGLRQRVEALLQAHAQAGDFMEQPPLENPNVAGAGASPLERPGDRIGRYKLLQQIGEGGCGVVYMAEQEEPVRRRVALKIIKAGMDTKSVIARFEAERQALAMMDHPNIAKVLDAGATESGRPYFVMELVRGVKISEYCDEHSLTTEERLKLFIQVCQAVQHAHQKGIIHRDIKPSNILVTTTENGVPSPVVIDFGIAKATTNQRLTDKTLFTAFEMLIGTPAYMSPEQAVLGSVDVDTRTDIYSLGVLLYELLTGVTPFDAGELLKAGLDEIRRVISEREPVRPSSRLSRMTKDDLTTVAHHRKAEPPRLIRAVHGDLDWIVMKALEKDRTRRYETANGLALDITRYLTNETIAARPASAVYRFRKVVVRNKVLFAGIGIVTALLLVSLVTISTSLAKEREARVEADAARRRADGARQQAESNAARARAEAAKSQEVTQFLEDMLGSVAPFVAQGQDTKMLRGILDRAATRIGGELSKQPAIQAELQTRIAIVYQQLGLREQAMALFQAALEGRRKLFGDESKEVADSLNYLALALLNQDDLAGAEKAYLEALHVRQKLFGPVNADVATSMDDLAQVYWRQGNFPASEALVRASFTARRQLFGDDNLDVAASLNSVAVLLTSQDKYAEAEVVMRDVWARRRKLLGPAHPLVVSSLHNLANFLDSEYKLAEAERLHREVLVQRRKLFGELHGEVARSVGALGWTLIKENKLAEAEATFREALAMQRKLTGKDLDYNITDDLSGLAVVLEKEGKWSEAEATARAALAGGLKYWSMARTAGELDKLVGLLVAEGKFNEAEQALAEFAAAHGAGKPESAGYLTARAKYQARCGRWTEAAADATRVVQLRPADALSYDLLAPLLIETHQPEKYLQLSREILAKFDGLLTAVTVDRLVIDCLILPSAQLDLNSVAKLSAKADRVGLAGLAVDRFQIGHALLEYRQQHYSQAIESAKSALHGSDARQAMAQAVLAMADFKMNQGVEAKAALTAGQALIARELPAPGSDDLVEYWSERVNAKALMSEAMALIEAAPVTRNGSGQPANP